MDTVDKETRSRIMRAIKSKNTGPERVMHAALQKKKLAYTRWAQLPGRPDFYFLEHKLVVDVFGCFFHDCPKHGTRPKTNKGFWNKKIRNNKKRDRKTRRALQAMGFTVMRFWKCEVNKDADKCVREIQNFMGVTNG